MRTRHAMVCLAAILMLAGCDRLPTDPALTPVQGSLAAAVDLQHVPVATRPHLLVSVDWLADNLRRPNVAVVHVGTLANYNAGHVPGAWFVDIASLQSTVDGVPFMLKSPDVLRSVLEAAGVSTAHHVIVTGDAPLPAARGFFVLDLLGHPRVSLLDGGRAAWQAAYGLSTEPAVAERPGKMRGPVRADRLATADWVLAHLGSEGIVLVDARPAASFAVSHIPGAASLPWTQLVESPAMPLHLPVQQLRALFAGTGADVRSEVVVYCASGMMSSINYFVARYLGYHVRLYDGSMLEWTALGLPLEG